MAVAGAIAADAIDAIAGRALGVARASPARQLGHAGVRRLVRVAEEVRADARDWFGTFSPVAIAA